MAKWYHTLFPTWLWREDSCYNARSEKRSPGGKWEYHLSTRSKSLPVRSVPGFWKRETNANTTRHTASPKNYAVIDTQSVQRSPDNCSQRRSRISLGRRQWRLQLKGGRLVEDVIFYDIVQACYEVYSRFISFTLTENMIHTTIGSGENSQTSNLRASQIVVAISFRSSSGNSMFFSLGDLRIAKE